MATAGQLLINEILPPEYRDNTRVLDKKGMQKLLKDIATKNPEKYSEIVGKLGRLGATFAQRSGGYSLASDLVTTPEVTKKHRERINAKLKKIYENDNLTSRQKDELVNQTMLEGGEALRKELIETLEADESPLALLRASGAKGNPFAVSAGVGFDGLYTGSSDNPIPYPVMHNYGEGLNLFEYWAGSFGARKGVVDTKLQVADAGFLAKQLSQVAHKGVISAQDATAGGFKPNTGLPATADDNGNVGRYLASPIGGYKRNTLITDAVLKDLQNKKINDILVRSPIVGGPGDGSLYAYDVGQTAKNRLSVSGENPSITAGQAISEQITQGSLSSKHCLAEGTLIRMADFSTKKIEEIKIGDYVLGVDKDQVAKPAQVSNIFNNGLQECSEYTFQIGKTEEYITVTCTDQHRFFATISRFSKKTNKNYTKNKSLRIGLNCDSYDALSVRSTYDFEGIRESRALLLGLLLGDGCFVKSVNGVFLSCHDDTLVPQLQAYMYLFNLKITELTDHYGYYRISRLKNKITARDNLGRVTSSERNPLKQWLKELNLYGAKSHQKFIPEVVKAWDKTSIAALIGGLWITDGSIYVTKKNTLALSFGSTSEQMVRELRNLLEVRFGIHSTRVYKTTSGRKRTLYSFNILRRKDIKLFYTEIPLYGVKRSKLKNNLDNISLKTQEKDKKYTLISSKGIGVQQVYDLEIANRTHLYLLANGLITHNSGGVAGGTAKAVSGFKSLNQMLQVPSVYEGAIHSQEDGKVTKIEPDELGNQIVTINNQQHIIPHTNKPTVKVGDVIEAGDTLSDGLPNPAEVVHHKGIGEGRRYFVQAFSDTLGAAGTRANKRNIELLAKGLIDHVRISEEHGNYLPDETVSYSQYEADYEPREDSQIGRPEYFANQYLEEPVLHYTIGTKLRPSVLANLKKYGIDKITANPNPAKFQSNMVRAMANTRYSNDWLTRMGGSYQKQSILEATQKGLTADPFGPSFYPAVVGRTDFTKQKPGQPNPIIKSVLPNLPNDAPHRPPISPFINEEDANWFAHDG